MTNPKRKEAAPDSKIIALHCNGLSYTDIGKELGITRQCVARAVKKHVERNGDVTDLEAVHAAVRIEITREDALSDMFEQGEEYTKNYKRCMTNNDEKGAYAWAIARRDLLDKKLKVTGLYNERAAPTEPIRIIFEDA
jgi:predicted transcriptional regulator